jgi:excisionase family DNA binding protein
MELPPQPATSAIQVFTTFETAKLLKVSQKTLQKLTARGKIQASRVGRQLRYRAADIERFLAECVVDTAVPHANTVD